MAAHPDDALTRRTRKVNPYGPIDYYYDRQWRAVEERVYSTVAASYVWSPVDRWTMIRRKRSVAGTLDETRYLLKDYLDPAAVIDTSAAVVERFGYDAFGPVRFMDASFATRTASALDWSFLFHAEFQDTDSGLYNYGYRYYHPDLGSWVSKDPIGERGGKNQYLSFSNNFTNNIDFLGLKDTSKEAQNKQCEGWRDKAKQDPEIKKMLERLDKLKDKNPGCKLSDIFCICCGDSPIMQDTPPETKGRYLDVGDTILICSDRAKDEEGVRNALIHEIKHVFQSCPDLNTLQLGNKTKCEKSMCMELQAYAAEPQYKDKSKADIVAKIMVNATKSALTDDGCKGKNNQQMMDMAVRLFDECTKQ